MTRSLVATALLLLTLSASAQTLKLTATPWSPYVDDRLYQQGVAIAVARTALERAGYNPVLTLGSWPQIMTATGNGTYDVLIGVWMTDERTSELAFSEPYLTNEIKFVRQTGSDVEFESLEDLSGLRIGVVDDYAYSREDVDTSGIEISTAGSVRENIESLLAGQLDLVLADSRVAMYEINQMVVARNIDLLPEAVITRGLRIAVSRTRADHADIVAAFDDAIAEMRADGTYASLLANFRISQ